MSDTLPLVCLPGNKRPQKTDAMRRAAAADLVERMIKSGAIEACDEERSVDDLVRVTRWRVGDGYEIARELDQSCGWDCDLDMAQQIDEFGSILDHTLAAAEVQWDKENPRAPAFSDGDAVVWRGMPAVVHGVYEYGPQRYKVRQGEMKGGSSAYYIVPFEDVSVPVI